MANSKPSWILVGFYLVLRVIWHWQILPCKQFSFKRYTSDSFKILVLRKRIGAYTCCYSIYIVICICHCHFIVVSTCKLFLFISTNILHINLNHLIVIDQFLAICHIDWKKCGILEIYLKMSFSHIEKNIWHWTKKIYIIITTLTKYVSFPGKILLKCCRINFAGRELQLYGPSLWIQLYAAHWQILWNNTTRLIFHRFVYPRIHEFSSVKSFHLFTYKSFNEILYPFLKK